MLGINLHSVVRGAITSMHPDEAVTLYQSQGSQNVKGKHTPAYALPIALLAQIQSESDDKLFHADKAGQNDVTRRIYLHSQASGSQAGEGQTILPAGVIRPKARGGDMILRAADNTWWKVVAVIDDFSNVEWVAVRVSLQVNPPEGISV